MASDDDAAWKSLVAQRKADEREHRERKTFEERQAQAALAAKELVREELEAHVRAQRRREQEEQREIERNRVEQEELALRHRREKLDAEWTVQVRLQKLRAAEARKRHEEELARIQAEEIAAKIHAREEELLQQAETRKVAQARVEEAARRREIENKMRAATILAEKRAEEEAALRAEDVDRQRKHEKMLEREAAEDDWKRRLAKTKAGRIAEETSEAAAQETLRRCEQEAAEKVLRVESLAKARKIAEIEQTRKAEEAAERQKQLDLQDREKLALREEKEAEIFLAQQKNVQAEEDERWWHEVRNNRKKWQAEIAESEAEKTREEARLQKKSMLETACTEEEDRARQAGPFVFSCLPRPPPPLSTAPRGISDEGSPVDAPQSDQPPCSDECGIGEDSDDYETCELQQRLVILRYVRKEAEEREIVIEMEKAEAARALEVKLHIKNEELLARLLIRDAWDKAEDEARARIRRQQQEEAAVQEWERMAMTAAEKQMRDYDFAIAVQMKKVQMARDAEKTEIEVEALAAEELEQSKAEEEETMTVTHQRKEVEVAELQEQAINQLRIKRAQEVVTEEAREYVLTAEAERQREQTAKDLMWKQEVRDATRRRNAKEAEIEMELAFNLETAQMRETGAALEVEFSLRAEAEAEKESALAAVAALQYREELEKKWENERRRLLDQILERQQEAEEELARKRLQTERDQQLDQTLKEEEQLRWEEAEDIAWRKEVSVARSRRHEKMERDEAAAELNSKCAAEQLKQAETERNEAREAAARREVEELLAQNQAVEDQEAADFQNEQADELMRRKGEAVAQEVRALFEQELASARLEALGRRVEEKKHWRQEVQKARVKRIERENAEQEEKNMQLARQRLLEETQNEERDEKANKERMEESVEAAMLEQFAEEINKHRARLEIAMRQRVLEEQVDRDSELQALLFAEAKARTEANNAWSEQISDYLAREDEQEKCAAATVQEMRLEAINAGILEVEGEPLQPVQFVTSITVNEEAAEIETLKHALEEKIRSEEEFMLERAVEEAETEMEESKLLAWRLTETEAEKRQAEEDAAWRIQIQAHRALTSDPDREAKWLEAVRARRWAVRSPSTQTVERTSLPPEHPGMPG